MITFWLSLFHPSTKRYFHQNCIPYGTFGHFLPFLGVSFRFKNELLFQGCCFLRFKLRRKGPLLLFSHFLHIFMALWKTLKPFEIEVTVFAVGRSGIRLFAVFANSGFDFRSEKGSLELAWAQKSQKGCFWTKPCFSSKSSVLPARQAFLAPSAAPSGNHWGSEKSHLGVLWVPTRRIMQVRRSIFEKSCVLPAREPLLHPSGAKRWPSGSE